MRLTVRDAVQGEFSARPQAMDRHGVSGRRLMSRPGKAPLPLHFPSTPLSPPPIYSKHTLTSTSAQARPPPRVLHRHNSPLPPARAHLPTLDVQNPPRHQSRQHPALGAALQPLPILPSQARRFRRRGPTDGSEERAEHVCGHAVLDGARGDYAEGV